MRFAKFIAVIWVAATVATTAQSCEFADDTLAMRDLIYSNDINGVEAAMNAHQTAYEAGERDVTEMRCIFYHFRRSRPETMEFIDVWLEKHPDSAFANAAKASSLFTHSWNVRGDKMANRTHPEAMATFRQMQSYAWTLANRANELRPRFVQGAEILIRNANGAGYPKRGITIFKKIMETDPNIGSYNRARNLHQRQWGWSWEQATAFCQKYAPDWEPVKDDPVLDCQIKASSGFQNKYEWRLATLKELKRPDLDFLRIGYLVRPDATAEDAAAAYSLLSRDDQLDDIHASYFDNHLAEKYDYPFLTDTIRARKHAFAKSRLEHDPYNVNFLEWLMIPVMETTVNEQGQRTSRVLERLSPEDQLDYDTRVLTMKPYNPRAWLNLQGTLGFAKPQMPIAKSLPLSVNAIYYGNHEPMYLINYMMRLIELYDAYGWQINGVPEELKAHVDVEALTRMFAGIDGERDIVCPFVRASRLRDHMCTEGMRIGECQPTEQLLQAFAVIENHAKSQGLCTKERSLPVETLAFSPVPMPDFDE